MDKAEKVFPLKLGYETLENENGLPQAYKGRKFKNSTQTDDSSVNFNRSKNEKMSLISTDPLGAIENLMQDQNLRTTSQQALGQLIKKNNSQYQEFIAFDTFDKKDEQKSPKHGNDELANFDTFCKNWE